MISHDDNRWNRFLDLAGHTLDAANLNAVQYTAWQCMHYLHCFCMGGHGEYLETVPHRTEDVAAALKVVGGQHFAENFLRAVREGRTDGFATADATLDSFIPSLEDCLKAYVEAHQKEIFNGCWEG